MPLYLKRTKPEHKVFETGCISRSYQDDEIRSRMPGWERCANPRHNKHDSQVCLKKKKMKKV